MYMESYFMANEWLAFECFCRSYSYPFCIVGCMLPRMVYIHICMLSSPTNFYCKCDLNMKMKLGGNWNDDKMMTMNVVEIKTSIYHPAQLGLIWKYLINKYPYSGIVWTIILWSHEILLQYPRPSGDNQWLWWKEIIANCSNISIPFETMRHNSLFIPK